MAGRRIDPESIREDLAGRCFICELLAGNPEFAHHVIYEDADAVAFLNKYPRLRGYVLVAPRKHREQVTGDFALDEYLRLQSVVHRVGEAIRRVLPTERLYILSLGSQEGNRHVHWHLVPLPPGVPFEQQQFAALDTNDVVDMTDAELADLAAQLKAQIELLGSDPSNAASTSKR
jgi:diadenosine tetraphosphate (Ap4A) HIT family hydrolase